MEKKDSYILINLGFFSQKWAQKCKDQQKENIESTHRKTNIIQGLVKTLRR